MNTVTLAELRTRCQQRFDAGVQNGYIADAEWNQLINEAGAHLHNWIVASNEWYIWKPFTISFVNNQSDYDLPADFYKDLKVYALSPSAANSTVNAYFPMRRFMPGEYRGGVSTYFRGPYQQPFGYAIMGNKIRFSPMPASASGLFSAEIQYAPKYTPLVQDGDVMACSVAPGWEEFVVNQVVINARLKEESDCTALMAEQAQIKQMIEQDMINRDMGRPQHVVDAESSWGWPYGPWGMNGWTY